MRTSSERTLKERLLSTKFIGFAVLTVAASAAAALGSMSWGEWALAVGGFYLTFSGSNAAVSRAHARSERGPIAEISNAEHVRVEE